MTSSTRIALVTGANRGIGRSTALALAEDGTDVIFTYRSHPEEADAVVAEIAGRGRVATALQLDTGVTASFAQFTSTLTATLRDTYGRERFDILVNNAGHSAMGAFEDVREEDFDRLVDVHFKGVFFLTQALLPLIADHGTIINISSGLTRFSFPGRVAYASVKGAVEVLTRYLAVELGDRGITVNTVAPGAVATDFSDGMLRDSEEMQGHIAAQTALRRHAVPEDIGPAIAALAGPRTGWGDRSADRSIRRDARLTIGSRPGGVASLEG